MAYILENYGETNWFLSTKSSQILLQSLKDNVQHFDSYVFCYEYDVPTRRRVYNHVDILVWSIWEVLQPKRTFESSGESKDGENKERNRETIGEFTK